MIINTVKLNKELSVLRQEKLGFVKSLEEESGKCKALEEEKAKLEKKLEEMEERVKALEEKIANAKKEEAAIVVATASTVDQKVVQKLASLGVPEGTVTDSVTKTETSTDPMAIYKTFEDLKGKEKIEFYKKNERVILNAMKTIHYKPVPNSVQTRF